MSIPVKVEGRRLHVALPTLLDFRTIRDHLVAERRRAGYAAIPRGLPQEEFERFKAAVDDECGRIDPFATFQDLLTAIMESDVQHAAIGALRYGDSLWLLYYALLRGSNPEVSADWVAGLVDRAMQNDPPALEGLQSLNAAFVELLRLKKNDQATEVAADPSISMPSTSN